MNYRAEIDGLRALAVVPVIFFHAGFESFNGGYVGVDVFLVISGYLITSLIIREKEDGSFTLLGFYERRARRILPALFFVVLVCVPFAWFLMFPSQFIDFARSVAAVSVFGSNILFWQESGYFAAAVEQKPLLHTWSLAVEEQFYILFPVFMIMLWGLGKRWVVTAIVTVSMIGLALSEWGWRNAPIPNFYLMPPRIWELGIGALAAFHLYKRTQAPRGAIADIGAAVGLLLIGFSVFAFDRTTPFPSLYALMPAGGAVLVILFASSTTLVGRFLSARILVGIGLISYSAYLWHQPLFAFARIRSLTAPEDLLLGALIFVTFLLAYLSWRFVERPFRNRQLITRRRIFEMAIAGSILLFVIGTIGTFFSPRVKAEVAAALLAQSDNNPRFGECRDQLPAEACTYGDDVDPTIVVWGDSHADQLMPLFDGIGKHTGRAFLEYAFPSCPPLIGVTSIRQPSARCEEKNRLALDAVLSDGGIELVVLHAYWQLYVDEEAAATVDAAATIGDAFDRTIGRLVDGGKSVLIIKGIPTMPVDPPEFYAKVYRAGGVVELVELPLEEHREATERFDAIVQGIVASSPSVFAFDPADRLCGSSGVCRTVEDDVILYRDDNHLSVTGSGVL